MTPTNHKPLQVYKASAGSGKTFQLAKQYIKLVVQNPQAYRNILAVTFTNKATEEMKMRILSQLYGIWKMYGQEERFPESVPYMNEICMELQATPAFVSERAGIALSHLLHNYNHFHVQTIDTFFQSVLRNLARELDLTANLRIGLNDAQVEELAVDELIDSLKTTDAMLQWIMKYIMDNISDDRSWNVIGQIKQFGKTIFRDYYKTDSHQLDMRLSEPGFFESYTGMLRQLRKTSKETMADFTRQFTDMLTDNGFTIDDLAHKNRGIAGFFTKLANGVFDESIVNQTVTNCLDDATKWYAKSHARADQLHSLAEDRLMPLLRTAVEERKEQWRICQSANLTLRHLSQLRLLSSIEHKVRELNEEANRFLLSDTQQLLATLISDSDTPFIYEKTGTQLDHIMIDEFQDTSTIQWQNFRVLLQETMSHNDSENLIVGDVKQSIYRWRGGDWRLLNNIEQQFPPEMVESKPLDINRRSSRRIIDFNSQFFKIAEAQERMALSDMPEAQQLERAYSDVVQKVPADKPDTGYVNIRLLAVDDNYQLQMLEATANAVDLLISKHVPQKKIAILVRTNNLIPLIANYFLEQMPAVRIISDEAFRLDASLTVNIIVKALYLLTHPTDQLVRAFLEKSLPEGLPATYTNHRLELLNLPLYELTECLFDILGLNQLDDQSAYVCAFYDQLSVYIADNVADIDSFLKEWEEDICAKTIQSDTVDGIRIISIHKSKGLEYENVIIPFCDWQLEKQSGNVLWCRPTVPPFNALPVVPVDYSRKGMMGTIYETDYRQEHLQNIVDNLNLLYVAFTRARDRLFVIGKRGSSNSRSAIIEQVLEKLEPPFSFFSSPSNDLCLEYGTFDNYVEPSKKTKDEEKKANVFLQQATPIPVQVETYKMKMQFRQSRQSVRFTEESDANNENSYIQLGSILHNVFSTIRTKDDIAPVLNQLQMDGVIGGGIKVEDRAISLATMLRKRLEHPKVADWFSPRWTLFNECTILSIEDEKLVEHRPDRVMTDGREWVVVDFKFGRPDSDHHEQVRTYMRLLRDMGHYPVSGFLWYVYNNQIEEVKEK